MNEFDGPECGQEFHISAAFLYIVYYNILLIFPTSNNNVAPNTVTSITIFGTAHLHAFILKIYIILISGIILRLRHLLVHPTSYSTSHKLLICMHFIGADFNTGPLLHTRHSKLRTCHVQIMIKEIEEYTIRNKTR